GIERLGQFRSGRHVLEHRSIPNRSDCGRFSAEKRMKNISSTGGSSGASASLEKAPSTLRQTHGLVFATAVFAAIASISGCSKPATEAPRKPAASGSNIKLTDAQKKNLHFYTVTSSKFHKRIDANAAVDFDNDRSTSVIAAFSGPVSRLIAPLGSHVKKG